MIRAGTIAWFAQHETRLAWRDWSWLLSGGRRRHGAAVVLGLIAFVLLMHGLAYLTLARLPALASPPDKRVLMIIGGTLALYWSLMLSQAMEAVTRVFYARGDLDLILSSPALAERLFAVRINAMAVTVAAMALMLAAPVINILACLGGVHWLAAYGVVAALAMVAAAISVAVTVLLFRMIGPKRTRLVAQIIAAVIGASFAIGVQIVAILSLGTVSRIALLQSDAVVDQAPNIDSILWLPAYAATGDYLAVTIILALGVMALVIAIRFCAPRFADLALAAAGAFDSPPRISRNKSRFRPTSTPQVLRHKEWTLLRRDPWLISQTLLQLFYLLPPFFLLWRTFYGDRSGAALVVPVLIMAAGQLAGGLAWLAISGEDAPDLIASAPITPSRIWGAKVETVLAAIGFVFGPFAVGLAVIDPSLGLVTALGVIAAAAAAAMIQFWFRAQVKRSLFRRRHVSSRIATFAEALSSITWAGTGALAIVNLWLAVVPGAIGLVILAGAWLVSPRRS
jgi:ABC-2 type transport system permease protein